MRCTWKEAGFLAYNYQWAGLHDLFIIIYTSSTYYLLIILNLTYSLGDVEGGWILRPPIIHGRGCGALEQSPRYREGSMKVQIRKYGGGNYDGIHIVGLTRICRFSPRIQQFSSRFRRELLNSLRESSNSRRDENCFSPLTTRIAQFSVTLERMRELLFSDEQRRQ